ncbi:Alpha-1,6-mannosyl-glycoprotein 6-beta-N-acetylglucosaminyltransferase [Plasmodiophora brassicae]
MRLVYAPGACPTVPMHAATGTRVRASSRCWQLAILVLVAILVLRNYYLGVISLSTDPRSMTTQKPPIRMFGCSLRAPATRVIQSALWFVPPVMKTVERHTISVMLALMSRDKESLCPPGRSSWVWVEDDTELCAGAMDHLDSIDRWIASLDDSNPLVYVRTSFGFNGHVVRCKKHDEFVQAVADVQGEPAIDDRLAELLTGRTAVYRWNLFNHRAGKSTIQVGSTGRRDLVTPTCYQLNTATLIWREQYDSRCLAVASAFSPCTEYIAPVAMFPSVPVRFPVASEQDSIVTVGDGTCDEICAPGRCSDERLQLLNERMKYDGVVPVLKDGSPACDVLTGSSSDADDQPIVVDNVCYARMGRLPVCSGTGVKKICTCEA